MKSLKSIIRIIIGKSEIGEKNFLIIYTLLAISYGYLLIALHNWNQISICDELLIFLLI